MGRKVGWREAHERLCGLAKRKSAYDLEEMHWLRMGKRLRVHVELGHGSFHECVERLFGYDPRQTYERLRVGGALEELPGTHAAMAENRLSIAREILCNMGFRDRDAKRATAAARTHVGHRPTVEQVVAAGLRAAPDPAGTKRYGRPQQPATAARESRAAYVRLSRAA